MENTKDLPRLSTRGPVAGDLGRRPGLGRSDPSGQAAEWDAGPAENELQGRRGRATSCSATGPSPHWAAGDPADGPPSLSCSLSAVCCCSGGWNGWPGAAARWADSEGRPGRYPGAATRAERSGAPARQDRGGAGCRAAAVPARPGPPDRPRTASVPLPAAGAGPPGSQDQDLRILGTAGPGKQDEPAEHAQQRKVSESH